MFSWWYERKVGRYGFKMYCLEGLTLRREQVTSWWCPWQICIFQGSHGQGKVREKLKKFQGQGKVRDFDFSQGNLKFWQKSGKSQGILESEVIYLDIEIAIIIA